MSALYLLLLVEPAIGLGVALLVSVFTARRREPELTSRRVLAAVVGVAVVAAVLYIRAWGTLSWLPLPPEVTYSPDGYWLARYLLPLVVGAVLVVASGWPIRARRAFGTATLERRGVLTSTSRWWLVGLAVLLVISVSVSIAAGLASGADENGNFTWYELPVGAGLSGGTMIYGWYFSSPSGIAILVLLVAYVAALFVISRSALRVDPAIDEFIRRHRARDATAATAGALLLHLGAVFASLGGTASMRLTFMVRTGDITVVGPFAALGPALGATGAVLTVLGFAAWWFVVVAAIRARRVAVSA